MRENVAPEELIPHRRPMLLVDKIVRVSETEALAETLIQPDAFFLQGHYPDFPIVPGVITCECLFQTGAALLAYRLEKDLPPDQVPVIARIERAKFRDPIRPGDRVHLKVILKEQVAGAFLMSGEARVADALKVSVDFTCALAPRSR